MRLLEREPDGNLILRQYIGEDVPTYAILSHTWGKDEVTLQDIEAGKGRNKDGWQKIDFCAKQAHVAGLRHIWVDTCCIDKKDAVELSAAINSMFRWYQNAARCYVYLSDIEVSEDERDNQRAWESDFRKSRWFTRCWTVQELIAPKLVDFYSREGSYLGSKASLRPLIAQITSIADGALQGDSLTDFTILERKSWAEHRQTTLEEDKVYSLLGIFGVHIPLIYGEGRDNAALRLEDAIHRALKGKLAIVLIACIACASLTKAGVKHDQFAVGRDILSHPEAVRFVGRQKELSEMHQVLFAPQVRSTVVLHGLGGIGKTQLAMAYIERHKEKYTAIFWLNANDEDSLKSSFRNAAGQIQRSQPSAGVLSTADGDLNKTMAAVKAWCDMPGNGRWLMVYDNYDNPKLPGQNQASALDIRGFLPRSDQGSIIITTRSSRVTSGRQIAIQKLHSIDDGLEILQITCKRPGVAADPHAKELVQQLDGLPLAISTAGAYLEHATVSFSEYLQLYNSSWLKLQSSSPGLTSYEDRSLHTTWQITFDLIAKQNPASALLLKIWAYFYRDDLWFDLLRRFVDDSSMEGLMKDELDFNEAMRKLCEFGLVDVTQSTQHRLDSSRYSIHSCVHSWTVYVLNKEWDKRLAGKALESVASNVPSLDEKTWWLLQRRLLQHALHLDAFVTEHAVDAKDLASAFFNLANLYSNQGKLAKAEKMYTRALQHYEERTESKHIAMLSIMNNLGILYAEQGKLVEAEKIYLRALHGREEALGPTHVLTLQTVNNLGLLYTNQDNLEEAEKMHMRALQGREEVLGPNHSSTLGTLNNLGLLYYTQGKLEEAEKKFKRALQGKEQALGPKHPSTLDTINNLGLLYVEQGKLVEAEKMYLRALQDTEVALGAKHISTLYTVNNLGRLYSKQGKPLEAEKMYTRALQDREEVLGPKHRSTLGTVSDLGAFYMHQGKLEQAEKMCLRALQGYKEILGLDPVSTCIPALESTFSYADLLARTGWKERAVEMLTQAQAECAKTQGPSSKWYLEAESRIEKMQAHQADCQEGDQYPFYVRKAREM